MKILDVIYRCNIGRGYKYVPIVADYFYITYRFTPPGCRGLISSDRIITDDGYLSDLQVMPDNTIRILTQHLREKL